MWVSQALPLVCFNLLLKCVYVGVLATEKREVEEHGVAGLCMPKEYQYYNEKVQRATTQCIQGVVSNCGIVVSMWETAQRSEGRRAVMLQFLRIIEAACENDAELPMRLYDCRSWR